MKTFSLIAMLLAVAASADAAVTFTDWTSVNLTTNVAIGTLGTATVTFSGSDIDGGVTNGTYTGFNATFFSPQLATSDQVSFRGAPSTYTYSFAFSQPVQDPRLHLQSLASTLTFSGISLTKLSGESLFVVSGDSVVGHVNDVPNGHDTNGTVQLNGTFSSISFTAFYGNVSQDDIAMQIGGTVIPEPSAALLLALAGGCAIGLKRSRRWDGFPAA